jgi:hypothetical protein
LFIGQREEHLHQRNTVGNGVVQPAQRSAAAIVIFDNVKMPQRLAEIERRTHQIADERLKFTLAAGRRQCNSMNVRIEIEIWIDLPFRQNTGRSPRFHPHPKTIKDQQPLLDDPMQPCDVDRLIEHQDAGDHHEVGGVFHPQPRGIGAGECLSSSCCHSALCSLARLSNPSITVIAALSYTEAGKVSTMIHRVRWKKPGGCVSFCNPRYVLAVQSLINWFVNAFITSTSVVSNPLSRRKVWVSRQFASSQKPNPSVLVLSLCQ